MVKKLLRQKCSGKLATEPSIGAVKLVRGKSTIGRYIPPSFRFPDDIFYDDCF